MQGDTLLERSKLVAKPSWIWKEIAEVIGVLGIIAGIVFLGYEMRQNTIAVRSEASQGLQNQIASVYQMLMDDSMMDTFIRGMNEPSTLSRLEMGQFHSFWTVSLQAYQNMYVQVREDAYDPQMAEGWWQLLPNNFESPGFREHWESRKFLLSAGFQEFVETQVMSREPTSEFIPFIVRE